MNAFNHFPEIAARLKPALQNGIKTTADLMQEAAASFAPVDTGFLKGSIYVSAWDGSTYGQGMAPTKSGSYLLPEQKPDDDMAAIVGCAANYGLYLEFGTRFMPAQPFLMPGAELAQQVYLDTLAKAVDEGLL